MTAGPTGRRGRGEVAIDVDEMRRWNVSGLVGIDAALVLQVPPNVGHDDARIADPRPQPPRRDERRAARGHWISTALLYIAIPHWKVSVRASVVGISTRTGVFKGRSFSSLTSLGVKPLLSTLTLVCWTPAAAGGMTGSVPFDGSPDFAQATPNKT